MMSEIKEKYQFVNRKIKDLENGTSEFDEQTYIGLTPEAGRYQGVIYKYGKVSAAEKENPDGTLNFKFEYDIVDNNGHKQEYFREDFMNLIGDIFVELIDEQNKSNDDA